MAAPSHGVGRGNCKLKNKKTDYVYSKIEYHQAIRDVRIELCRFSSFLFENAVIGAGNVSKVPKRKTPRTATLRKRRWSVYTNQARLVSSRCLYETTVRVEPIDRVYLRSSPTSLSGKSEMFRSAQPPIWNISTY